MPDRNGKIFYTSITSLSHISKFNWYVAASSIVIDSAALSIQAMSQLLITDANLGIDLEMIAKRPYSPYYWGTKFLTSLIAGIVLGVINVILLLLFGLPWGGVLPLLSNFTSCLRFWCCYGFYRLELVMANEKSLLFH